MILVPDHYPLWLQKDIAEANRLLPQVNIFVFFADDLPFTQELLNYSMNRDLSKAGKIKPPSLLQITRARVSHLHALSAIIDPQMRYRRPRLVTPALSTIGRVISNSRQEKFDQHELSCFSRYRLTKSPTQAIIQLPPLRWTDQDCLQYSTKLWHAHTNNLPPLNFHRAVFWHEVGHLDDDTYPVSRITTPKDNERRADFYSQMQLEQSGQPEQARALMAWRRVDNFLEAFSPKQANYWNFVDGLASPKTAYAEIAAMAEVKLRALGETQHAPQSIKLPRNAEVAAKWLAKLPSDSPFHTFNRLASSVNWAPHIMLQALAQAVERDEFTFPHSRKLAKDTLASSRFLLPAVFNNASATTSLRPLDSPCLIGPQEKRKWYSFIYERGCGVAG